MSENAKRDPAAASSPAARPQERRVELVRLQTIEAQVVAARLRAAGYDATLGAIPVYESVGFTDGVPVLVFESDVEAARALLTDDDSSQERGA